jgi:PKD repeat protein
LFTLAIISVLLVAVNNCEVSAETGNPSSYDLNGIVNYLDYNLNHGQGLLNFVFTLDSYELLGMETPNKTQVIEYLNSLQTDDGTWATGQNHYVPITAQILMFYSRSGVKPAKSLEPFFSTVDNWQDVVQDVQTYDKGNPWGGLWGYVASYVVYKGERPPWTTEFLNAINDNFSTWADTNHQRTHAIGSLLLLSEPIPRINEVINITLSQQNKDGSWESSEEETVGTIQVLKLIENQTSVGTREQIDTAIAKGLEFVDTCYKTFELEGKTCAGFALTPSEQPSPRPTAFGIWALLNPESDIWFRWAPHMYASFGYSPGNPVVNEQIAFDASASYSPGVSIASYEWNFGDGNTTKLTVPVIYHTYSLPGNYLVTLKVTDDSNLSNATTKTITVSSKSTQSFVYASFGYSPGNPVVNEQIAFDASASYSPGVSIASYEWNFGDGNTTKLTVPVIYHTYSLPGNYLVTLKVTDDSNLWNTTKKTIAVDPAPPVYTGISRFNVSLNGLNYTIIVESNSALTNFNFNQSLRQISFIVSGSPGTVGYCNISIPKALMWPDPSSEWKVTVGGSSVENLKVSAEGSQTWLYFTYIHSTHQVIIVTVDAIPEFPLALIILFIITIITLGVIIARKRLLRNRQ